MALLSIPQIAQLAADAGIPGGQPLYTATAVALAESGGRTDAVSPDGDQGVWQINPVHDEKLPGQSRFDPVVNAQLMAMISSNGTNWSPWVAYTNGSYTKHMGEVVRTLQNQPIVPGQPADGLAGTGSGPGGGLAAQSASFSGSVDKISKVLALLSDPQAWVRILKVIIGFQFIIIGVIMLVGSARTVRGAVQTAVDVGKTAATKGKL